ncbi:DUF4280 domain-containing protein [Clostridium estertheticum]|uniref:DUF4280 domain-containing protein n=1 Tax=Clostridium estertheticum TaxID=238834 RepID=A0AA47I717_9CLOT|nr:PAAR-like protein [Clostridium estertheticum]WAG62152.1 DUF4280 domain-containing protein [Clostridium estertheticum]
MFYKIIIIKKPHYFGICSECKEGEDIYLIGEDGVQLPPGKKCLVEISGDWMNVKEDTLVDGKPALTAESVLLHQGKIKFVTTGQEQE